MRRILSEAEVERKRKRNAKIMSLVMLSILLLSSVGFAFSYYSTNDNGQVSEENSLGYGTIQVGENTIYLHYPLSDVMNVSIESQKTIEEYYGNNVYVSSEGSVVFQEIYSSIGNYASKVQEACYGNCSLDLPEKDCTQNLIVWRDSGENRIYEKEKCVFIDGDLRAVDAFIYRLFGKI